MDSITTRNESYKTVKPTRRETVFNALKQKPMTNKELSKYLDWPINSVTGRTKELVSEGRVVQSGTKKDPVSGKTVVIWSAKTLF